MTAGRRHWFWIIGLSAAPVLGQTAGMLSFQGLIKDVDGNPVVDPVDLAFGIFDAEVDGNLVAGPFGPTGVTPNIGVVSTKFGPVAPSAFDGCDPSSPCRWLEVSVDGNPLSRIEMATAPATAEQVNIPGTGTPVITVTSSGNVGIGTSTPLVPFHVNVPDLQSGGFVLDTPNTRLHIRENENAEGWIRFRTSIGNGIMFTDDTSSPQLVIEEATGNVGIGTTSPVVPLHVVAPDLDSGGIVLDTPNTRLHVYEAMDTPSWIRFRPSAGQGFMFTNDGNAPRLTIKETGNIGIGTTEPQNNLDVIGTLSTDVIRLPNGAAPGTSQVSLGLTDSAGAISTFGNNFNWNVTLSHVAGDSNRGHMAVRDSAGEIQAGMFVDSNGDGIVFGSNIELNVGAPDDPGAEIWYAAPVGPESACYIRGTGHLVDGRATIQCPDHFRAIANVEGMTVLLTPLSADCKGLAVTHKGLDAVVVQELSGGTGTYDFDYLIMAERKGYEDHRVVRPAGEVRAGSAAMVADTPRENPYHP